MGRQSSLHAVDDSMTTDNTIATEIHTHAGCFSSTIHTGSPRGHLETIYGLPSYITRGTATSNSTIIFLTDGYGFNLVHNKLLADQYATKTGFRVLMPNVLPGGGLPLVMLDLARTMMTGVAWWNVQGRARRAWTALRLTAVLVPFHLQVKRRYPDVLRYIRAVKASLPLGSRLGVAGFCLGGHWSSRVCGEAAAEGRADSQLIDAHFAANPSRVRAEELVAFATSFRVPFSLALGDQDSKGPMLSVADAHQVEAGLREVFRDEPDKVQVEIYEKCGYGFALRVDPYATQEDEGADRALEQAVAWFRRFLA